MVFLLGVKFSVSPLIKVGAKLSGAKLSWAKLSRCQIVWYQIVHFLILSICILSAKLSAFTLLVSNCPVPNCPVPNWPGAKLARCQIVLAPPQDPAKDSTSYSRPNFNFKIQAQNIDQTSPFWSSPS